MLFREQNATSFFCKCSLVHFNTVLAAHQWHRPNWWYGKVKSRASSILSHGAIPVVSLHTFAGTIWQHLFQAFGQKSRGSIPAELSICWVQRSSASLCNMYYWTIRTPDHFASNIFILQNKNISKPLVYVNVQFCNLSLQVFHVSTHLSDVYWLKVCHLKKGYC